MGNSTIYGHTTVAPAMEGTITIEQWATFDQWSTFGAPRLRVQKYWRMMCIPEWWVVEDVGMYWSSVRPDPAKIAGPFKTKQAAEAALLMMEE